MLPYTAKPYARLYSGHQSESGSARGGRQFIGQAEHLTFESACRLLYAKHSYLNTLTYLLTYSPYAANDAYCIWCSGVKNGQVSRPRVAACVATSLASFLLHKTAERRRLMTNECHGGRGDDERSL